MCTHLDKTGSTYYFRRPVPKDLAGHFVTATGKPRTEWKFSLGTKDREEAKRLLRPHVIQTDKLIDDARTKVAQPLRLPAAPAVPRSPAQLDRDRARWEWEQEQDALRFAEQERQDNEIEDLEPIMDAIEAGTVPDASPAEIARAAQLAIRHEREIGQANTEAAVMRKIAASAVPPDQQKLTDTPAVSIKALFERYAGTGAANPKTVDKWRGRVAALVDRLGHDDATRVTRADLNGWTAALAAKGLAKKTIVDGYLPAVRAALSIAHDDGLIPANPASALKVRAPKPVKLRERDLTDDEAATILRASLQPMPEKLAAEHALARRWVPWLCAYTGARVGEITQLRACDIQQEGEIWLINITPEAGSVKTSKARKVPLHSHLIEQGFAKLAKAGAETPLFYRDGAGNEINPAAKIRTTDIAKWVRSLGITAPQPNHGWRHRFKTMARLHGMTEATADAIQGHVPRHEGGKYGSMPLPVLAEAIGKLPRYLT